MSDIPYCPTSPTVTLVNVFHHHPSQPITLVSSCQDYLLPHQRDMSQQQNAQLSSREGRIQLACSAYTTRQFRSLRRAAEAFNVPHSTLTSRYNGITHILERRNGRQKLTTTEEQTIVRYISSTSIRKDLCPGCTRWQIWLINCWLYAVVSQLASTGLSAL